MVQVTRQSADQENARALRELAARKKAALKKSRVAEAYLDSLTSAELIERRF